MYWEMLHTAGPSVSNCDMYVYILCMYVCVVCYVLSEIRLERSGGEEREVPC